MFCKFTKLEMYFLVIASFFYCLLNFKTSLWYPLPWCDEIMYTDPSVNFVLGNGFTSTAWSSISSDSFWAGNTPLYQFVLIPWIYCFGIGPMQVRSLNVINIVISNVLIIIAMRRFGLFKSFYTICFFFPFGVLWDWASSYGTRWQAGFHSTTCGFNWAFFLYCANKI